MFDQIDRSIVAAGVSLALIGLAWTYSSKSARVRPNEPPMLPGSLPILGHALRFGKDANKVYIEARNWSGKGLQPVSLSLLGQRMYVILNPKDVAAVWRAKTLSFEPVVKWSLAAVFGLSTDALQQMHSDPDGAGDMYENQHVYFRDALAPGSSLNQANGAFLKQFKTDMTSVIQEIKSAPGGELRVDLLDWVRNRIAISSTNAFMGTKLLQHDPKMIQRLNQWEEDFGTLTMGLPKWLIKAYDNLDKLHDNFVAVGKDGEMLPWMVKRIEMMEVRGIGPKDVGAGMFTLWMALLVNAVPTSFWMLYQILGDPAITSKIQEEIAPAFDANNNLIDLEYLVQKTPFLTAIYWEALRWTSGAVSVRKVEEDTMIGGAMLYAGGMVMIPARTNNTDPNLFGDNADDFVADRFLRDPASLKHVRAFGGGHTLCPGRHFANNEIVAFVATALREFVITIDPSQAGARPLTSAMIVGTFYPDRKVYATVKLKN